MRIKHKSIKLIKIIYIFQHIGSGVKSHSCKDSRDFIKNNDQIS